MRALTFATLLLAIAALPARAQFSAQGNPFGQPGTAGQATRGSDASGSKSGLENSRSFVLGPLGTPGHWEIKGDGSGPIMIGDQVYIPGGPGQKGQFVDTGTSLDAKIIGTSGGGGGGGSGTIRSSRQILSEVESRRKQRQAQQQKPEEEKAELPALPIRDLGGTALPRLLELVDAPDPATRASALAALPATTVPAPMRMAVVRKLLVALDDEDLRVVRVAAGSLGRLKALAAQEKLIALLNIEDPDTAVAAIDALAEIGSALALPALEQLAGLDQGTVAGAAARAVATIRLATPATPAASSRASRP